MTLETRNCDCLDLRSARPSDLPEVLALLRSAQLPAAGVAEAFSHFVVAEHQGKLVGAAGLEVYGASALLRSVVVEDSWRGSGVGRRLIDHALGEAKQRGIEDVFLLTTTAEHYFPRFGFACVSRDSVTDEVMASVEFQGACPSSAVVMRKTLSGAGR
jgi:amino-acid N-acetyltransferase